MTQKKCHNCGIKDSIHRKDEASSRLLCEQGPPDSDGLIMFFIYCRSCGFVNIYKPGWFGNIKFASLLNSKALYEASKEGKIENTFLKVLGAKIQKAMIKDGVLPKSMEI